MSTGWFDFKKSFVECFSQFQQKCIYAFILKLVVTKLTIKKGQLQLMTYYLSDHYGCFNSNLIKNKSVLVN